jgi:hypothetical protein
VDLLVSCNDLFDADSSLDGDLDGVLAVSPGIRILSAFVSG